ncbi:MAG: DUF456 domain-containing protein [Actinomycetota bacterium]
MDIGVVVLIGLVMAVGLIGTLLPLLPGLPLVWAAALVYGLAEGFEGAGTVAFTLITLLAGTGIVAGLVLPHRRVAAKGAPASIVAAGVALGIIGFFVIPVVGLVIGAVGGVLLAERARTGDWTIAWATTRDLLVGFGIGVAVEFGAGLAMVLCWVAWLLLT